MLTRRVKSFEKISSVLATFAGVAAFLYAISFVVLSKNSPVMGSVLSALFLMIFGILASGAWIGLYRKLKEVDNGFAIWVVVLAIFGTMGAFVHGGFDLSNALNPPTAFTGDVVSQIDPRGLLTFGLSGLALMLGSLMISSHKKMSTNLGNLGYLAGLLSIFIYLARLIIVDATSFVVTAPAIFSGFIVIPLWYVWVGRALKNQETVTESIVETDFMSTKTTLGKRRQRKIEV